MPDYISFLVTGIFVFNFTQRAFLTSSQVIRETLPLIRALYFPRACLPLGYVLIELQQLLLSFAVLFVIILIAGEPLTPYWLLILPALVLQSVFNVGAGLILARWGSGFDDVSQLLPFIVRTWLYVSGVLFSLQSLSLKAAAGQSSDDRVPAADQPGRGLHHADPVRAAGEVPERHARGQALTTPRTASSTT